MQISPPTSAAAAITRTSTLPPLQFSPLILSSHRFRRTQIIVCAKRGKNRSQFQKSQKQILKSIAVLASNLKIIPEPFDFLVKELIGGGGNGGGGGIPGWFGFGGSGDGNGKGRGRRRKLGFWVLLIAVLSSIWVVLEREGRLDLIWVFAIFVILAIGGGRWRRKNGLVNWGLGFCCGGVLVGVGLKREVLVKWFRDEIKGRRFSSVHGIVKKIRKNM